MSKRTHDATKNSEGKWDVEYQGNVYEFDSRKEARAWIDDGYPLDDEEEAEETPEASEEPAEEENAEPGQEEEEAVNMPWQTSAPVEVLNEVDETVSVGLDENGDIEVYLEQEDEYSQGDECPPEPTSDEEHPWCSEAIKIINVTSRKMSAKLRGLCELGKNQTEVLSLLIPGEGVPQRELVAQMNTSKTNVGTAIYKLEDDEYVESKRSKLDRRSYDIYLTDKGQEIHTDIVGKRAKAVEDIFSNLTGNEMETFIELLRKLN